MRSPQASRLVQQMTIAIIRHGHPSMLKAALAEEQLNGKAPYRYSQRVAGNLAYAVTAQPHPAVGT